MDRVTKENLLLEHADRGFEVPLTSPEARDYLEYRRDRDVIPGKLGVAQPHKPKNGNGKDKKPFVDRVLEKSLEYLRQEIKKVAAATADVKVG